MNIIKTDDFDKSFRKLPKEIQQLYFTKEKYLVTNWRDPRLHIKRIALLPHAFSFRITRRYRVFLYFQNQGTAIFFEIDHRKDAYRK